MFSLVPQVQAAVDATSFGNVINPVITAIVDPAIELMVLVAIVVFVWGVVQMIVNGGDPEARSKGKGHMLWGVIGMVIMISAWAIVYIISNTLKGS
jgi:hypothetical protein